MIGHNHFICHLILGTFTEYPEIIATAIKQATSRIHSHCEHDTGGFLFMLILVYQNIRLTRAIPATKASTSALVL